MRRCGKAWHAMACHGQKHRQNEEAASTTVREHARPQRCFVLRFFLAWQAPGRMISFWLWPWLCLDSYSYSTAPYSKHTTWPPVFQGSSCAPQGTYL